MARRRTDGSYDWLRCGVVNVTAVPGQEVIHAVNGCHRDVQGIGLSIGRHASMGDQPPGEFLHLVIHREFRDVCQPIESPFRRARIARGSLGQNQFGSEKLVLGPLLFPPLGGNLLPCGRRSRLGKEVK